jgi:alpha-beta hydrolase superfamily lysophospholipase
LKSDYLKLLAENLAANGIASLRYDKRGVAKSKYNGKEENVVFDDFALDAASWIARLKTDPRFSKIIVMGHSEGSLLGMLAIQRSAADGFVSVAGAGRPIDFVLKEQLHANANNPASLIQAADGIIDSLKMGLQVKQVPMLLSGLFRPGVQPFLISWMKYDPAVEIKKLNIPVMIVHGTTDIQVSKADAEALRIAYSTATYQEIEGMNHVLRAAPADRSENIKTYFRPDLPLKEELIRSLTEFVQRFQ